MRASMSKCLFGKHIYFIDPQLGVIHIAADTVISILGLQSDRSLIFLPRLPQTQSKCQNLTPFWTKLKGVFVAFKECLKKQIFDPPPHPPFNKYSKLQGLGPIFGNPPFQLKITLCVFIATLSFHRLLIISTIYCMKQLLVLIYFMHKENDIGKVKIAHC